MKIQVLGSAAGGGFPQWNCNCRNCAGVRNGTLRAFPRTQSSLAVCGHDERQWTLVNASPDILVQLKTAPMLSPAAGVRDSPIRGVVLVDAQIDHSTGLLMLRESRQALKVWCTQHAHADLTQGNPIFRVLTHYCGVQWHELPFDGTAFAVAGSPGIEWRALSVASKPAPYSPHRERPRPGDNVALELHDRASGARLVYAPGLGSVEPPVWEALARAHCVLVDGTFWSDAEMIALGVSGKLARELGHLPQSGPGGMLEWLDRLPEATRRILIHVNNTNPILDEDSPERAELQRRRIEVARDGMELSL